QEAEHDILLVREEGDRIDHQLLTDGPGGKTVRPSECAAGEVFNGDGGSIVPARFTSDGEKKNEVPKYDNDCHSIAPTDGGGYVDGDGIVEKKCNGVEEERRLQELQQQQQEQEQPHQQTSRDFSDPGMTEGIAIIPETPVDRGLNIFTGPGQEPR
ncbi:unnamed protein product, partial [Ectocarpus sp. 13 AM-2016]